MNRFLLSGVLAAMTALVSSVAAQTVRESIQWLDVWIPNTNDRALPRVLLIGDSITRGYGKQVEAGLKDKAYVARLATSKSLGDPALPEQIALILREHTFDVIHFNNGMHGDGYSEEAYAAALPELLATLRRGAPRARLIFATTTDVRERDKLEHALPKTDRMVKRNELLAAFAKTENIPVNDLFAVVRDHPEYHAADGVHFADKGYEALAAQVVREVVKVLDSAPARPTAPARPIRDPHTEGYVKALELADGANARVADDGNFILGPTHPAAPEMTAQEGVPHGVIYHFTMESTDSKFYPGVVRDPAPPNAPRPAPGTPRVIHNHAAPYTRKVAVYVPQQYVPGTAAPFIVGADGPDNGLFTALDNLIAQHRLPAMIAISIGNGGGDGPGSERGLEYDTMSAKYAEFVEAEVLPLVEQQYHVKLTRDPEGRATMGGSSGGSVALAMAWFHPELYHRVLTYSGTYVNNQYPVDPELPHGAWELHEHLIPNSPKKPLRIWMEVGDRDNGGTGDVMHDWVVANENMAKALAAKGYPYQFVFARNAGHTDGAVKKQTLPEALEYIWRGYPIDAAK